MPGILADTSSSATSQNNALVPQQCLESDIWIDGPGSALQPQAPPAELRDLLSQIDPSRIETIINKLVSFGTRHTLSSQTDPVRGIGAARDWLAAEMRSLAAQAVPGTPATVDVQSFIQQPASAIPVATNITNIITTIPGVSDPGRVYLISGHYDSRVTNLSNSVDDAPGADDDGSGVAIVLELIRLMVQRPPPQATVMLVAVAGEEQGLYGSTFLAQSLLEAGADVQGMFTNDIVGSPKADNGFVDPNSIRLFAQGIPSSEDEEQVALRVSVGGENDSPARQLARFVNEVASNEVTNMSVRVVYRADRYLRGGDHEPFLDRGFTAARFTEPHENFAHQHQDVRVDPVTGEQFGDLAEFCDFDFIARVGRVNGAALWSLANAPGTPKNVTIDTSVLTNNSTLTWAMGMDEGLAGYEIVWRETDEPFWTNVVPVGLVSKAVILLAKDNSAMGVRAVGTNGLRSPATFPFPST
ncbi:Zn-dependent exopeptidase [Obba rivulosa]|uniref:Peptide hydrolase n=1 Tax=Obba rivulosa TaxID=1052685 RepID=A0A8E2DJP3_9APHY|nr:Zn-dependent exopeptidase [Obba rivulosa]